jgi:head-tail adaptor
MLTASDLTAMRSTLGTSLPGTVVIQRSTQSSDGMGGVSDAWANVGTVSARVSPSGVGLDDLVGGEFTNVTPWVVTLPAGTNVTDRDRIAYDGQTFEVVAIDSPRSYATCVRVQCKEVG